MRSRATVFATLLLMSAAGSASMYAAPRMVPGPMHALFGNKAKLVKFVLRNESGEPLQLQCGDQAMTVESGKSLELALPVGTQVKTKSATKTMAEGATVASVTTELAGSTITVR